MHQGTDRKRDRKETVRLAPEASVNLATNSHFSVTEGAHTEEHNVSPTAAEPLRFGACLAGQCTARRKNLHEKRCFELKAR